ncbi:MAG: HypC/HybG/HupF family hydrogenase formation chaperone [Desulfobacterota bacterium]|nr:HypC/HybG/HupF family hydrogenase formation chaperone [Thermodesulfobacteriota bacterium]
MCLAVPSQIKSIEGNFAEVEIGGVWRKVNIILTPEAKVGDYILVHTGYSIGILNEEEAEATIKLFNELGMV